MKRTWITFLIVSAWTSCVWSNPPDYRVEAMGACTLPGLSDAVKSSLQESGYRVSDPAGVLCEIWLRKVLPLEDTASGQSYGALAPGVFAGVISYSGKAGDYRGRAVKPGLYTMRIAILPADGNHMGVSPTSDYLLLSPADLDKDPAATVEYQQLLDLSRKASGTVHPVPLYLVEPTGSSGVMRDLGDNHHALEAKTKASKGGSGPQIDFPIALVLVGKGEG